MDNMEDILNPSSTKVNKMENTPKPANNGSKVKVKLKVAKRKVNIRRNSRFNRSNTSFNTSLNASKVMKKTLVANNRDLADAVQMSKHEIAVNTERIVNLQKENIELMLENGKLKHNLTQVIEDQVNDRVKPLIQLFKSKVCEVSIHLTDVASAIKELSSAVASQNKGFSNANSRANSVEIHQNLFNMESTKRSSIEKEEKSGVDAPTLRRNSFNLSLIAESSYLNCDRSFDSFSTLDMVPENELDKCKTSNDITSLQNNIPPKRVSVEKRGSWLSRDSLNRRKSIKDEIDFGPHVAKNRKIRRSSFLIVPPLAYEKSLSPDPETPLKDGDTKNDEEQNDNFERTVKTTQLPNPTLIDADDDATILIDVPLSIKSMEVDTAYKEEEIKPQPSASSSELNILQTPPADPVQQEDLAPVVNNNCPVTTNTLPLDNTQEINHTNVSEIDMELTEVINSSMQVGIEVSPFPVVQSANEVKEFAPAENLGTKDNQDGAFLKPIQIPKTKTSSKKGEKKPSKKTKEKTKEATVDDDGKAVVELRLTKPGKFIFSAVRKNIAGIRPSPPKARSKKKIAAMKKDELEAEPKNLFDFHDKTPQLLAKKPEVAADTGIYDVSLNDSVYGTCQSLGEYRERVAMAKRINPVHSTDVPLNSAASASSVRTEVSANILETAAEVEPEEKKNRARSKKTVNEDKRGRSRSRKRVEDSDGDSDLDNTYVKQYEKTAKSSIHVDATERHPTRRARSKVISYKEVESDFDVTVTETIVPVLCLKNAKTEEKETHSVDDNTSKETKSNMLSTLNSHETESKTAVKKETIRKSLKGTQEKRACSRKKSMTEVNTRKLESSDNPTLEGTENSAPEKAPENKTPFELLNLMSRLEKLQKKQSHTQHNVEVRSGEESENPVETKSKSEDIFERYKRALTASNNGDHNGEMRRTESSRSRSRSRSRPARTESPKTMSLQDQCGRSRSLRAMKSKCDDDDAVKITPKRRSRSVAKKEQKSHDSNSTGDMVKSMAEEYRSQSPAREEPKPDESKEMDDNVNPTSEKKRTRSVVAKKTKSSASDDGLGHHVNPTPEKKRSRSVAAKKTKVNASEDGVDHNVQSTPEKKRSRSVAAKKLRSDESKDISDDVKTTPDKKHRQSVAAKRLTSSEYHDINDKIISKPESKRSRSVAKKINAASPPSSPLKKSAESPEVGRHQKVERGRSKSRVDDDTKSKPAVSGARYSSVEKNKTSEGSPETLRQKQRVRSKGTFLKNDKDDKVALHVDTEAVNSETNSDHIKPVGFTMTGMKFKSSVVDKENINTDVNISHMDGIKKPTKICQSESSHKEVKSTSRISTRVSLADSEDKTLNVFTRISSEKYPNSKRSAEYVTEENPDLKRPRRAIKPISYKELSIGKKLRQGDSFFSTEGIFHNGQDEETRKRSILDNVTNLHL